MIKLHEEYVVNEQGKCSAVILNIKEYRQLLELLEDLADSQYVKNHRKEKKVSFDEFAKQLQGEKVV